MFQELVFSVENIQQVMTRLFVDCVHHLLEGSICVLAEYGLHCNRHNISSYQRQTQNSKHTQIKVFEYIGAQVKVSKTFGTVP